MEEVNLLALPVAPKLPSPLSSSGTVHDQVSHAKYNTQLHIQKYVVYNLLSEACAVFHTVGLFYMATVNCTCAMQLLSYSMNAIYIS